MKSRPIVEKCLKLLAVVALLAVAALPWTATVRGPRYQGRTLEEWLDQDQGGIYRATSDSVARLPSVVAIRSLGSNMVPALVREIQRAAQAQDKFHQRETSAIERWFLLRKMLGKVMDRFRIKPVDRTPLSKADNRLILAAYLVATTPESQGGGPTAFVRLVSELSATAQGQAPASFRFIDDSNGRILAVLTNLLTEPTGASKSVALGCIGALGPQASAIMPQLKELAGHEGAVCRPAAMRAVAGVGREDPRAVRFLVDIATNSELEYVVLGSIVNLKPAVALTAEPLLLKIGNDPTRPASGIAQFVLRAIKAGVGQTNR